MKLSKLIFVLETDPSKTPFKLLQDQIRIPSTITSAGWFNLNGERLGNGDLDLCDMRNISRDISPGEAFIVLPELDSSWAFPTWLNRNSPGKDYVYQNAHWVICKNSIIRVRKNIVHPAKVVDKGIEYLRMSQTDFYNTLRYTPKPIVEPKKQTLKEIWNSVPGLKKK